MDISIPEPLRSRASRLRLSRNLILDDRGNFEPKGRKSVFHRLSCADHPWSVTVMPHRAGIAMTGRSLAIVSQG